MTDTKDDNTQSNQARDAALEETRRKIAAGMASADAGRLIDGPAFMRRLRRHLYERAKREGKR